MSKLTRKMRLVLWIMDSHFHRKLSLDTPKKVTVLITYFHPIRMKYIEPQLRNILKCTFVESIVVSNHNPEIKIEERVRIRDDRLIFINQDSKRPCGYRWRVAHSLQAENLIVIDDDVLLFPAQLKTLFYHLVKEPEIPHGFTGMLMNENGSYQYRECENIDVNYLCEIYAVTRDHVNRYIELEKRLANQDKTLLDAIEQQVDFILISQTGVANPRIHEVSRLFRNETFKAPGIAIHKSEKFPESLERISHLVENIRTLETPQTLDPGSTNISSTDFVAGLKTRS